MQKGKSKNKDEEEPCSTAVAPAADPNQLPTLLLTLDWNYCKRQMENKF